MSQKYEINPAFFYSSIFCPMIKLDGSLVSDRCLSGNLFLFLRNLGLDRAYNVASMAHYPVLFSCLPTIAMENI